MKGFLKIQGKATILVKNMRTTVRSSNRSTGKLEKIKQEIEEVEKNGSNSKANFRELYKEVVSCLAVKESGTFKQELKTVSGEAQKCYMQMEELSEEMDCQLVTNKSIKEKTVIEQSLHKDIEKLKDEKAKMEESLRKDIEKLKDEKAKMEESLRKDIEKLKDEKAKMEESLRKDRL